MPLIRLQRPAIAQPQGFAEIDWSNPLANGLVFWWTPTPSALHVNGGAPGVLSGAMPTVAPKAPGLGANFGQSGLEIQDARLRATKSSDQTYLVFGSPPPTNGWTIALTTGSGAFRRWANYFSIHTYPSGVIELATQDQWSSEAVVVAQTTADRSQYGFYVNNINRVDYGGTTADTYGITQPQLFQGESGDRSSATYWAANTYVVLKWDRLLSRSEIASISANPWQIFRDDLLIGFAAAGGGANFTWTGSGGISFAGAATAVEANFYAQTGAGGLAFGGTAAATGGASYTHTATGGLSMGGAATTTETNNYSQTASGGIAFGGAATASGGGSFDFIASGGLLLAGTAGISFTAAHQFAGSGGIKFSGSASALVDVGPGDLLVALERYTLHAAARQFDLSAKKRRTEISA